MVTGDELHLAHNFFFLNLPWSATGFRAAVDEFEDLTREAGWPAWCLNNHDHSRTATRYGLGRARVAAMLVLTLRGTPFLYQGEELGLTDAHPRRADRRRRRLGPSAGAHAVGTPKQAGSAAGFSDGAPWLPVHPDAERLAVGARAGDPLGAQLYRALIALRRAEPALREGTHRSLGAAPDVFAFLREHDGRRLLVTLNFAPFPRPLPAEAGGGRLLLATHHEPGGAELRPDEGRVIDSPGARAAGGRRRAGRGTSAPHAVRALSVAGSS